MEESNKERQKAQHELALRDKLAAEERQRLQAEREKVELAQRAASIVAKEALAEKRRIEDERIRLHEELVQRAREDLLFAELKETEMEQENRRREAQHRPVDIAVTETVEAIANLWRQRLAAQRRQGEKQNPSRPHGE